jgi:hypothetical protein
VAALLQARDTAEVLIKFSACVLLQGLLAAGGDAADWARRAAFQRGLSVGNRVQTLREAIDRTAPARQTRRIEPGLWVLRALDRARVDRNYDSPAYLRADLAAFLAENASGVYWLQAPAHVGKTTFIQGLAGDSDLSDAPIEARFDPHANRTGTSQTTGAAAPGAIVAYYCRKEYRPGVGALLARLEERLAAVYDPSDNVKNDRPLLLTRDGQPTPGRFVAWLQVWREFAARRIHLTRHLGPLIVCIDGLDESCPPGEADWPLQLLPPPDLLPDGLYLVLTSRPLDDPTAPVFLGTHIAPLYRGEMAELA